MTQLKTGPKRWQVIHRIGHQLPNKLLKNQRNTNYIYNENSFHTHRIGKNGSLTTLGAGWR